MEFYYKQEQPATPERPVLPKHLRFRKRWVIAQSKPNMKLIQVCNANTEYVYHHVLLQVKKLYSSVQETVFEKDSKTDNSLCAFAMHSFICASFLFRLECTFDYIYKVEYQFDNCPFEAEIRWLLKASPTPERVSEISKYPSLPTFFQAVLTQQDDHYITKL